MELKKLCNLRRERFFKFVRRKILSRHTLGLGLGRGVLNGRLADHDVLRLLGCPELKRVLHLRDRLRLYGLLKALVGF